MAAALHRALELSKQTPTASRCRRPACVLISSSALSVFSHSFTPYVVLLQGAVFCIGTLWRDQHVQLCAHLCC